MSRRARGGAPLTRGGRTHGDRDDGGGRFSKASVATVATLLALGTVLVAIPAVLLAMELRPETFTRLGRIHADISVGDAADDVWAKLDAYCAGRRGPDTSCTRSPPQPSSPRPMVTCASGALATEVLHVHDLGPTDDRQLYVLVDAEGRVCATRFWAD